jgi:hypothetical protein
MGTIRQAIVALPPISEKKHIALKFNLLMKGCNEVGQTIKENQNNSKLLMEAVLKEVLHLNEKR